MGETLPNKMLNFRAEKDLTQKELAKELGMAEGTIVSAEKGKSIRKINEIKILNYINKNMEG